MKIFKNIKSRIELQQENNTLKILLKEQYDINYELEQELDAKSDKIHDLKQRIKEIKKEK